MSKLAEYMLCLGYVCLAAPSAIEALEPQLLLGAAAERAVVAGFDGGDYALLGRMTQQAGWVPAITASNLS